jgi:iron complex outermembrane receptor protein
MIEGDLFQAKAGEPVHQLFTNQGFISRAFTSLVNTSGGSVLGRWNHDFPGGSQTTLQLYDNDYTLSNQGVRERLNSADLEFLHHFTFGSRHDIVWGLEYRHNHYSIGSGYSVAMLPPVRNFTLVSGFFQDQIRLTHSIWFTLGSKVEHNAFTGVETDPSASLTWVINNRQTLWASAAKAVRTPSLVEESFRIGLASFPLMGGGLGVYTLFGNRHFQSEQLRDYEVGYRVQAARNISLDFATFYSFYHNLATLEPGTPFFEASPAPPHVEFPSVWGNGMHGQDYGAEAALDWEPFHRWKIRGAYSWLKMNLHLDPNSQDRNSTAAERVSPAHQFNIHSYFDITRKWSFDNSFYYVASLSGFQFSSYAPTVDVPSYVRLDSRLAWQIDKSVEASVVGQNLLSPWHFEFGNIDQFISTQPERSVFGEMRWSF